MKITLLCVGPLRKAFVKEGFGDYYKRIKRYAPFEVVEVREESASQKTPKEDALRREGERILKRLGEGDYVIALSDNGMEFTSVAFSAFLGKLLGGGAGVRKGIVFIIGGAYGLHPSVTERSNEVIALSRMTLPHELCRLVFAEQLYRAFTIIRGEPYSH